MSHVNMLYHIVLRTKYSIMAINEEHETELYAYMMGIIQRKNGAVYRIGGMPDHVHILTSIHHTLAVSEFIKVFKGETSKWMKESGKFPEFVGWGKGYAAFSYNIRDKHIICQYIANQKAHHKRIRFEDEYIAFLKENGMDPDLDLIFKD